MGSIWSLQKRSISSWFQQYVMDKQGTPKCTSHSHSLVNHPLLKDKHTPDIFIEKMFLNGQHCLLVYLFWVWESVTHRLSQSVILMTHIPQTKEKETENRKKERKKKEEEKENKQTRLLRWQKRNVVVSYLLLYLDSIIYIHTVDKHRFLFWVTNKGCSVNVWGALVDGFCLAYLLCLYVPFDPFSFLSRYVEFELYLGFIVFLLLYIVCVVLFIYFGAVDEGHV